MKLRGTIVDASTGGALVRQEVHVHVKQVGLDDVGGMNGDIGVDCMVGCRGEAERLIDLVARCGGKLVELVEPLDLVDTPSLV